MTFEIIQYQRTIYGWTGARIHDSWIYSKSRCQLRINQKNKLEQDVGSDCISSDHCLSFYLTLMCNGVAHYEPDVSDKVLV